MQVTETSLRHQRAAVHAHAAEGFRHPYRVTGKQVVIFGRTQEPYDTQLYNHLVYQLLCFFFRQFPLADIFLDIDVEERRSTPYGHGRTILVLHRSQISQIYKLHGFAGILGRTGHVESVCGTHLLKILQGTNLLRNLFTVADDFIIQFLDVKAFLEFFLVLNQTCRTIQGHTTVVTDNPSTAVCIRQTCNNGRTATCQHFIGIS